MIQQTHYKLAIFCTQIVDFCRPQHQEAIEKKVYSSVVFPPLQKQQVLIGHNKFVVLIKQLTFQETQPARLTGCSYKILAVSHIMHKQTKRRPSISFNLPAKSFIPALFHFPAPSLPSSADSPRG